MNFLTTAKNRVLQIYNFIRKWKKPKSLVDKKKVKEREEIEKIQIIFRDFTEFEPESVDQYDFNNLITKIYDPPSYVVQFLMLGILKFRNFGRMDKVHWHTYFSYKNENFMIRDYKFGRWTIEGVRQNDNIDILAKQINAKITKASKKLDKVISRELEPHVEKENFFLNNTYPKLSSIYEFYESKVSTEINNYDILIKSKKPKGIIEIAELINEENTQERIISNYAFAHVLIFFSTLDFLFDAFFAFERPDKNFNEFRKDRWYDKFKLIFPIKDNPELKRIYDSLVEIKKKYRNPLAHGITHDLNILIAMPSVGLIPVSYESLSDKVSYGTVEIGRDEATEIVTIFSDFFLFLEKKSPYRYYHKYLEYAFPIPLDKEEIGKIKKEMTSFEDFEKYLDERTQYEDAIRNRDF